MKTLSRSAVIFLLLAFYSPSHAESPASKLAAVDLNASEILWTGKKILGSHNGSVKLKSAKLEMAGSEIAKAEFEADMTSIQVSDLSAPGPNAKLTGHLKSEDFFGTDKYPTALFKSTGIKALPIDGKATHEVTGDLTIKGITQAITFPMKMTLEGGKAMATATLTVDRTRYGIRYGSGKFFQNLGDKTIDDRFQVDVKIIANL